MRRQRQFAEMLGLAALVTGSSLAMAQVPTEIPEAPTVKKVAPVDPVAPAAAPAAPAPGAAGSAASTPAAKGDDLPWLGPPAPAGKKTANTPSDKKAAASKTPPKCEEQQEDSCRALPNCAWVAHIPQADGSFAAPRCAEKKAPVAVKKSTTAAKPKPKPQPKPDIPPAAEKALSEKPVESAPAEPAATPKTEAPKESAIKSEETPKEAAKPPSGSPAVPGFIVVEPPAVSKAPVTPPVQAVVKVPAQSGPSAAAAETTQVSPVTVEPVKPKTP